MSNAVKICRVCGVEKPLEGFPKRSTAKDGRRIECLECNRAAQKAQRLARIEEVRERDRRKYERNKERVIEARRRFRAAERDRLSEQRRARRVADPERFRKMERDSYRANREKKLARDKARNFRRRTVSIAALLERDGEFCGICHQPLTDPSIAEIDHIVPRAIGGSNEMENLQLAHSICNRSKSRFGHPLEMEYLASA